MFYSLLKSLIHAISKKYVGLYFKENKYGKKSWDEPLCHVLWPLFWSHS